MFKILITGKGSYVGESIKNYILSNSTNFQIESVDTMIDTWINIDYTKYDVIYHVAGIAHVNAAYKMKALYYKVNRDLTIEIAKRGKEAGVKQFIFMSSQIVFHESRSLRSEILTKDSKPNPNGFYGDSKLQAENGLRKLESPTFKVCILRPPIIYGPNSKGNFLRLAKLAIKTPLFPAYHNKRSMLYIDNLAEFVKQAIIHHISGTFYPQNSELSDIVEIVRFFANRAGHKIGIWRILNPCVTIGGKFFQSVNKMFATYYYDPQMSKMDFEYQLVSLEESLKIMAKYLHIFKQKDQNKFANKKHYDN